MGPRPAQVHGTQPFLVHISTDAVYEGTSHTYKEWAGLRPTTAYGRLVLWQVARGGCSSAEV